MPEPVIDVVVYGKDSVAFTWFHEGRKNYTIRARSIPSGVGRRMNKWRGIGRWPIENGVPRTSEYYSRDLREFGSGLDMVEVCFPWSGAPLMDAGGGVLPSFVEQISLDLPNVTVIGYTRGGVNAVPDTLTRALSDEGSAFSERIEPLGRLEAAKSAAVVRFQNGELLHPNRTQAQRFQPYHKRVAEARKGSAGAGTSSMPSGAPEASGARAGRSGAGLEGMGEGAPDLGLPDLGPYLGLEFL